MSIIILVLTFSVDAYAVISCGQYSAVSRVMPQSLAPQWNQTLLIDSIKIYGNTNAVCHAPPAVVVKFYDKDTIVSEITY